MRALGIVLVCMVALGAPSAPATAIELGGELTAASDYMFRGVSQTLSGAALQAGLAAEHDAGWYGLAWVSNVDFAPSGAPDDGADLEANLAIGYSHDLGDSASVTVEHVAYLFPGTRTGYNYDYTEWIASLEFIGQHRLTFGFSEDVFNAGGNGRFYAAASTFELTSRVSLEVELGYYDLTDALASSYAYAETALSYHSGALLWRLGFVTSDDRARELFDASTVSDRFVAGVTISF